MSQSGRLRVVPGVLPPSVLTDISVQTGISPVVPAGNTITFNGAVVAAGTNPVRTDGTGASTMALEVQISQAIASTDASKIGLSNFDSASFAVDSNGFVTLSGSGIYISLSPFIVGSDVHSGYSTIATAITAAIADGASASNPKNIYIKPKSGGYTENLTLSDGINLIGFGSSSSGGVATTKITGKLTMTTAGTASVNNLVLSTNGDYVVEVTGSAAVNVILDGCYINASNANAIHVTNTSAGVTLQKCFGNCSTNTFFILTGGSINASYCTLTGSNTTTNSTFANSNFNMMYTFMSCPVTTSGTGSIGMYMSQLVCANTIALTHGGSGSSTAQNSRFEAGTQSGVSIGGTLSMVHCTVDSTNTNAITGAGTLKHGFIVFTNTSSTVNTVTSTALATLI